MAPFSPGEVAPTQAPLLDILRELAPLGFVKQLDR